MMKFLNLILMRFNYQISIKKIRVKPTEAIETIQVGKIRVRGTSIITDSELRKMRNDTVGY